jgi:hypothetical protein
MASKVSIEFANIVDTEDPVELHIIEQLQRLQYQNKRLLEHIDQTNTWTQLKKVEEWKPFDFYHYFCNKYSEICRKQYKAEQNLTRVYRRIEEFIKINKIANKEYKLFIDRAFERFFNAVNAPHVGHICSPNLFSHLMRRPARITNQSEYFKLDQQLELENEQFEKYVQKNGLYEHRAVAGR